MEFLMSYFKSWNMMLWKYHTQYASKFVKLSSGHRTGKSHSSPEMPFFEIFIPIPKKGNAKNVQTTAQLHLSHTLAEFFSEFSKVGFSSTWTENFQMFKLDLEKAEEPEIKLSTCIGSLKKQESSRKTSISALLTMPKPLIVWITTNCGTFLNIWKYQTTLPAS